MTIRNVGDAVLYLGAVATALAAIGLLVRYVAVRPLKRWISEQTKPSRETADQVNPNGGGQETTRHLIEQTAESTTAMQGQLDSLAVKADENREIATAALALARETSQRLDRHLVSEYHLPKPLEP